MRVASSFVHSKVQPARGAFSLLLKRPMNRNEGEREFAMKTKTQRISKIRWSQQVRRHKGGPRRPRNCVQWQTLCHPCPLNRNVSKSEVVQNSRAALRPGLMMVKVIDWDAEYLSDLKVCLLLVSMLRRTGDIQTKAVKGVQRKDGKTMPFSHLHKRDRLLKVAIGLIALHHVTFLHVTVLSGAFVSYRAILCESKSPLLCTLVSANLTLAENLPWRTWWPRLSAHVINAYDGTPCSSNRLFTENDEFCKWSVYVHIHDMW